MQKDIQTRHKPRSTLTFASLLVTGLLVLSSVAMQPSWAQTQTPLTFTSGSQQAQLVELYTSQGCSSCPPADAWLSQYQDNNKLWQDFVPIAYHVDYWDYLGWKDPFAHPQHGSRQRSNARKVDAGVYTPGVFLNQTEWRGWRRSRSPKTQLLDKRLNDTTPVGVLTGTLNASGLRVEFTPDQKSALSLVTGATNAPKSLAVEVVLLESGQATQILAGENQGRRLQQDFIASNLTQVVMQPNDGAWHARVPISPNAATSAIAFWVLDPQGNYIQATGGWLNR